MTVLQDYRPAAQAVNRQSALSDRSASWWGKMLTNIALAVGPVEASAVQYVTATLENGRYQIAVFTEELLITGEVENADDDDAPFTVKVFSLGDITGVSLGARSSIFADEAFVDWPGQLQVGLTHATGGEFIFPYSRESNDFANGKFSALVPKLLERVKSRS